MHGPSRRTARPRPDLTCLATWTILALSAATSVSAQAAADAAAQAGLPAELVQVRTNLDKYQDPIVAVHDGYLSSVACVEFKKGSEGQMHYPVGGMGVHFINLQTVGQPLDPAHPQVLIYEPAGGKLKLAAAEWFVPTAAAGGKVPTILGQRLQGPMEGHAPIQPKGLHHYDLHVWLWRHNPAGTFSPTNPTVVCPQGGYSFKDQPPKMLTQ
jgi:hypothetical protein